MTFASIDAYGALLQSPMCLRSGIKRHMPCRSRALVELPDSACEAPVRALAFDLQGQWLMAAGDDKLVKVWHLPGMMLHCQW